MVNKRMRMMKKTFLSVSALAAVMAATTPTMAQQQATAAPQQMQQVEITDTMIQQFATVQQKLQPLRNHYQSELQQTGGDEKQMAQIKVQAAQEMTQIVKNSPLTVAEYNQIAMTLPQDQGLQQRFREALQ